MKFTDIFKVFFVDEEVLDGEKRTVLVKLTEKEVSEIKRLRRLRMQYTYNMGNLTDFEIREFLNSPPL